MSKKITEFLKECIADAILELLQEKPLGKITVDEICTRSGVGRATYFRHFKSKEEAIIYKRTLLWSRYCSANGVEIRDRFYIGNAQHFFQYNYDVKDMTLLLYQTGNEKILFEVYDRMTEIPHCIPEVIYREKFLLFGLFGLLDTWARSGFQDSPEMMCRCLERIAASIDQGNFGPLVNLST